jgi:radical SAM protein with 4Fe4S-binding SPASM domain
MDCPSNTGLELDSWGERVASKLLRKRYPLSTIIELTERCNLRCVHCYVNQPANDPVQKQTELSADQFKQIIDKIAQAGTLFVCFTGGEPLLREDFEEIYVHAIKSGLLVTLFTNATLLTPRIADTLGAYRPVMVDITLYGATRETYEKVTGVSGAFDACMRGIRLLREREIKLGLKTVVMTLNQSELAQMQALAAENGAHFRYDGNLWPRLDGDASPRTFQIPAEDLLALDFNDAERLEAWQEQANLAKARNLRADYIYACGAGMRSYGINSRGEMSICGMVQRPVYNLLEVSFAEAWEQLGNLRLQKRQKPSLCQTCGLGGLCTNCPGFSQAANGDDDSPEEFICTLAHMRAVNFDV